MEPFYVNCLLHVKIIPNIQCTINHDYHNVETDEATVKIARFEDNPVFPVAQAGCPADNSAQQG
jgi:hypothetical protein